MTNTKLNEALRNHYIAHLAELLTHEGEEVLTVGSHEISLPVVDADGNEKFLNITVKVPKGSGDEAYDGYEAAEGYKFECAEKAKKKAEAEAKKQAKIERDTKRRAEAKAKKEAHKASEGETK